MRRLLTLAVLLLLAPAGGDASAPAGVHDFDAAGLVQTLLTHSVVVTFHTRWCELCAAAAPAFDRVAEAFGGLQDAGGHELVFGRVDVDAHRAVAKSFGVRNVPFVTLLRHGDWFVWDDAVGEPVPREARRFDGAITPGALAAWLNNSTGLSVTWRPEVEELTPATLRAAIEDDAHDVLVEFYGARCIEFEDQYRAVGAHFATVPHTRVTRIDMHAHRHLVAKHNISGLPTFILYPRGAHKRRGLVFHGARSRASLVDFVRSPGAYLLEADVAARGGGACLEPLRARGVVPPLDALETDGRRAEAVIDAAHRSAIARVWGDALEALLCLAATPALRYTGAGSSPAVWNLLDNVRLRFEEAALSRASGGNGNANDDASEDRGAVDGDGPAPSAAPDGIASGPPLDVWERFREEAAKRASLVGERDEL